MDWKTIEQLSRMPGKKWFYTAADLCELLGYNKAVVAAFLAKQSVPWYRIGKGKAYFLPEILEAAAKTRWKGETG